jgi:hypothetical protein
MVENDFSNNSRYVGPFAELKTQCYQQFPLVSHSKRNPENSLYGFNNSIFRMY